MHIFYYLFWKWNKVSDITGKEQRTEEHDAENKMESDEESRGKKINTNSQIFDKGKEGS